MNGGGTKAGVNIFTRELSKYLENNTFFLRELVENEYGSFLRWIKIVASS